jgi:hypothetical protein
VFRVMSRAAAYASLLFAALTIWALINGSL